MIGVNKVILVGNMGRDPEVKFLEGGIAVAKFSLATTETFKDKNGNRIEQTEWHNIVMWRAQAEVAQKYLRKGMTLYIEGKIRSRQWEDKEGHKKNITEIVADSFTILSKKEDNQQAQSATTTTDTAVNEGPGDLPF